MLHPGEDAKILERAIDRQKILAKRHNPAVSLYRALVAQEADAYMRSGLALDDYQIQPALEKLQARETFLIQLTAAAHLWRLGTVRALAKALRWAAIIESEYRQPALVLLAYGDKVAPRSSSDLRRLRYYEAGCPPAQPLSYGLPAGSHSLPADKIPPPTTQRLLRLQARVLRVLPKNIEFGQRRGYALRDGDELRSRIGQQFQLLQETAECTTSLSAWRMRYLYQTMQEGLLAQPNLAIFPLSRTVPAFPKLIHKLFVCGYEINPLKPRAPDDAQERREEPGKLRTKLPTTSSETHLRGYCPACGHACDAWIMQIGSRVQLSLQCNACGRDGIDFVDTIETSPSPRVGQAVFSALGIALQVVTRYPAQSEWVDRVAQWVFHRTPPVCLYLSRRTRFSGLGEPEVGCPKAQLPRALFDMAAPHLLQTLAESNCLDAEIRIQPMA